MSDFAQKQIQKMMFKKLMEEQAVDADYPVHEKVKGEMFIQKQYGSATANMDTILKASAWMNKFLGDNNPHKEN